MWPLQGSCWAPPHRDAESGKQIAQVWPLPPTQSHPVPAAPCGPHVQHLTSGRSLSGNSLGTFLLSVGEASPAPCPGGGDIRVAQPERRAESVPPPAACPLLSASPAGQGLPGQDWSVGRGAAQGTLRRGSHGMDGTWPLAGAAGRTLGLQGFRPGDLGRGAGQTPRLRASGCGPRLLGTLCLWPSLLEP